jgi:hypothetical protein
VVLEAVSHFFENVKKIFSSKNHNYSIWIRKVLNHKNTELIPKIL